jgi:hypothetical protein
MKFNENMLPILNRKTLNLIFESVYGIEAGVKDEQMREFIEMLLAMQLYNKAYRNNAYMQLAEIFQETLGPFPTNTELPELWFALGLAIKELYGMRKSTLRALLLKVNLT